MADGPHPMSDGRPVRTRKPTSRLLRPTNRRPGTRLQGIRSWREKNCASTDLDARKFTSQWEERLPSPRLQVSQWLEPISQEFFHSERSEAVTQRAERARPGFPFPFIFGAIALPWENSQRSFSR